jgi:phage tail sheath protein FI
MVKIKINIFKDMSNLTITSPGVQINEVDLSIITRPIGITDVLITGFAPQGPTEEMVRVSSVSEYESVFGTPTNAAERYLYHSARQILSQSPANLMVTRLPYGENLGDGYANSYSALVYQISSNNVLYEDSTEFEILPPVSVLLSDDEYYQIISNEIEWKDSPYLYVTGDESFPFGVPLTNATSAITTGQRVYGLTETPLSSISYLKFEQLFGAEATTPLHHGLTANNAPVYAYVDALWNNLTGTPFQTNVYNSELFGAGDLELVQINNYFYLLEEDEDYNQDYGDYTLCYNLSTYDFQQSEFLTPVQSVNDILDGNAGLIVVNSSKTAVNNLFEGYYVGIADNSNFNPNTDYDSIRKLKSVGSFSNEGTQNFVDIPTKRLNFTLTQQSSSYAKDSLSKITEQYPIGYDFATTSFNDSLVLMLFKIKSTQYNQDTVQLDYSVAEGYAGSLYSNRTQNNIYGGTPVSFYLDTVINNKSSNLKIITNPYISTRGTWIDNDGLPAKKVRVKDTAKAAYASGVYTVTNSTDTKDLGRVDLKLSRFLDVLSNDDTTNIDIIADSGLSTIWATAKSKATADNTTEFLYDESYTPLDIDDTAGIKNTSVNTVPSGITLDAYQAITSKFVAFANSRKDHLFISDPLKQIFVRGLNTKTSSNKKFIFSSDIYWPLNNIYNSIQSSYVAAYGNWVKTNDQFSGKAVWVPSSGHVSAIIAQSSQSTFPWIAPAGFNRGTLTNVLDIAINPTQKQRDLLYKINVNPIAFFNQDGFVIYGQKTMYRKPSAFDRINVRRLFLTLEKATQKLLKYYVFEPNSFATRNRLKGALTPLFDQAKLNDGCYDYLLVCDTTNNTPLVIDNNELRISIYIQPVRSAEFILSDFIGTRTGVNFSELIAGGQS